VVQTTDKGHGRIEVRRLEASEALVEHCDHWPGLAQVCKITRRRIVRGQEGVNIVYAITSLPRERADAARLLALSRGHWGIENRLHLARDASLGEDACRTRSGAAPQVLAAFRNTALSCLRRLGFKPVEGFEHFAEHRDQALNFVLHGRTE
jgi:predicted transposase YbfD/YdcC